MAETTTIGRVMMAEALPPGHKDISAPFDSKKLNAVLDAYAREDPDRWPEVMRNVERVSLLAGSSFGGRASPGLDDLEPPKELADLRTALRAKVRAISQDPKISPKDKGQMIVKAMLPEMAKVQGLITATGMNKNTFIDHAIIGARGSLSQAMQLLFGDMVVVDHKERPVPIPGLHGYGEGVTPAEFWAGAYGARKGLIDLQMATPDAGYLCLHGDTLVRMADFSVKKIRDIEVGDRVMGADTTGRAFETRVTAKFNNGTRAVKEFVFRKGAARRESISIVATAEHRALAAFKRGKISSKPLAVRPLGDARKNFSLKPAFGFESNHGRRFDLAFFIGALLGDGCTSGHNATFSCADDTLVDFLNSYLDRHGLSLTRIVRPGYKAPDIEFYVGCGGPSGYVSNGRSIKSIPSAFTSLLKKLGLFGKRSWEKTIPDVVEGWDKLSVAELLGGIWSTDGCATPSNLSKLPVLRLGMTSEKLVGKVKELMEVRFGIYSSPVIKSCAGVGKTRLMRRYDVAVTGNRPVYTICVSNSCSVRRFLDEIPMRGRKMAHLKMLMEGFTGSARDMSYSFTYQGSKCAGEAETFDIEVDCPRHLFVLANGAIVSNSKQLKHAAHREVVTADDCGADGVGMTVDGSNPDNVGALLAAPAGGLDRGHVLTARDLTALEGSRIVIRSAVTCRMPEGVCSKCAGMRESGDLPAIGDHIGLTSAAAIAEPMTQAVISSKHTGGVAGVDDKKTKGFKAVNQIFQVPKSSPDWAPLAPEDGSVASLDKADQGGWYATIGKNKIYIPQTSALKIKTGDHVEAGDALASGIPNPARIAELKGLGEARQYYVGLLAATLKENGAANHRRNSEVMAKSFLSRVEITDLDGVNGHFPGDVVSHSALTADWEPRPGTQTVSARQAAGMYLEAPYMHMLIGDRVSKSAAEKLAAAGVKTVLAHADPPQFRPVVSSVLDIGTDDPDWQTRLGGFNLKSSLIDSASRGSTSDPAGTSYIPKIVSGRL